MNSHAKDVSTSTESSVVNDEPKVTKSPTRVIHVIDTTESVDEDW